MKTNLKIFSILFEFLTTKPSNARLFIWKFIVALEIIFYITKYYLERWFYYFWFKIKDDVYWLELKSFIFIIFSSFFIYYFIVIELSILLFGHSLLCYRFLFIFIVLLLLIAWRLEAEFLRYEMYTNFQAPLSTWVKFYNNQNPLSFSDFITNYKNWPLFWLLVIGWYRNDLQDGRLILITFFIFLIFFFIYSCSYWFDPRFVKFVAKYFHPVVNFFETRWNPWLEDFSSATIWFWNRILSIHEASKKPDPYYIKILKMLPKPSTEMEDRANLQWSTKISLRKSNWFSDIFFLRAVRLQPELRRIVFDTEQPTIIMGWFDPNWKLLFLRYIKSQQIDKNSNFWKKYFIQDPSFWNLIKIFKKQVNSEVDLINQQMITHYSNTNKFAMTIFESLLSDNYFNSLKLDSKPFYQKFGSNWDFYNNLTTNNKIEKVRYVKHLKDLFTSVVYQTPPLTITGLLDYNKKTKKKDILQQKLKEKINLNTLAAKILLKELQSKNFSEFVNFTRYDLDVPLYVYSNTETFQTKNLDFISSILKKPLTTRWIAELLTVYNYWLTNLENKLKLQETPYLFWDVDNLSFDFMLTQIDKRLQWIDNIINSQDFLSFLKNEIPRIEDIKYLVWKYIKLPNSFTFTDWRVAGVNVTPKEQEKEKKDVDIKKYNFFYISQKQLDEFLILEKKLWIYERSLNQWQCNTINFEKRNQPLENNSATPWYIRSLSYFGTTDYRYVLPGFLRYYAPTPYPTTFSTFGFSWIKYQFYWKNTTSTVVGYSDNIAELKNSTPLALYSGVEAIIYVKPFFDLIDVIVKLILRLMTYPIEIIITENPFNLLSWTFSIVFFVHLVWFLHFYIYMFVFIYIFYYFLLYYNWKIGYLWFYEWMFEENVLSQYNNWVFWHSVSDIWLNYKTPEQLLGFAVHTNLLLHYTFFNYTNYFYFQKNNLYNIINLLVSLTKISSFSKNYLFFTKQFALLNNKIGILNDISIFWSFFNIWAKWYTPLLFDGGSNCSVDHLLWNYLEYLSQTSNFLSWSLWANIYQINKINELNSLIKQFTILISNYSLTTNNLFMPTPILDTVLAWKIIIYLTDYLNKQINSNFLHLRNEIFFDTKIEKIIFSYVLLADYKFDFYNYHITSGLDLYQVLGAKHFNFLTKLNSSSFWDDKKYWFLAFFRSFRFISKSWFPSLNIHYSYESTWLQLAWLAYSNSWITQSTYIRPFFNIIQHLWWTSRFYLWAFNLINNHLNLNQPGINIIDNVWNFLEKWYSLLLSRKVETVFGLVRTLNLTPNFYLRNYGLVPYENKNYDLSFPDSMLKKTTNRDYLKTNPGLDMLELGLNPNFFFKFFKHLPFSYFWFYLTFLNQLELIDPNFKTFKWNLNKEFSKLDIFSGVMTPLDHNIYSKYEFYFKKFDFNSKFSTKNPQANWIFCFDISYFFTHFLTWDFFSNTKNVKRPTTFKNNQTIFDTELLTDFSTNLDMIAKLKINDHWFKKPFGILDKFELHSIKKYKSVKVLDNNSFTRNREDVFLSLDKEHTKSEIGYSIYPQQEENNLAQAYSEEFSGQRQKWFPYNPTIVWNSISPLIVGWVGELYFNSNEISSFLYSLLYASPEIQVNSFKNQNLLTSTKFLNKGYTKYLLTFFAKNNYLLELFSWSFTWVNLMLNPYNSRYCYGPKALAWLDYWSWKCGITIDYWNGLYLYWPYLGLWHSFFTWLVPYDPLYGFYRTYRQIEDNPLIVDLSTNAMDKFVPWDDATVLEDYKSSVKTDGIKKNWNSWLDPALRKEFSMPYWEIYYSFHHPYFIGYLFFWILILSSNKFYLGLSNFSFKRLIIWEFFLWNLLSDLTFQTFIELRQKQENKFWKQMFKYWIYYSNPTLLMSLLDCTIDDELLQQINNNNTLHKFFLMNQYLFKFLTNSFNFSPTDIVYLLDFAKIYNHSFFINWLTLDLPFAVNPYIVTSFYKSPFLNNNLLQFQKFQQFSFSHNDSLRENYNFNLFYDWSSGVYLDSINLISYLGTTKATTTINNIFFENPAYIATSTIWLKNNQSKFFAKKFQKQVINYSNYDLIISNDMSLHNFSILDFFQESVSFFLTIESNFLEWKNFFQLLNFYVKSSNFNDFNKYNVRGLSEIDSKISSVVLKRFSKMKQFFFLYRSYRLISFDVLTNWITTGLLFNNWMQLNIFYKSFWLRLYTRYRFLSNFYNRVAIPLVLFFFKKK